MLELLLIVLLFLSSRFSEYAVLAIILVYGAWGVYMKTFRPQTYISIQEAEDRRRSNALATVQRLVSRGFQFLCKSCDDS